MARWLLESIEITGGFLSGLSLQLPRRPGLTCIIGPRGTGKSTLVEAIRYGMGTAIVGGKARQDLIQANLGAAVITMRTTPDANGTAYVLSRRHRAATSIATVDGRTLPSVDLERGTFLPLDAYSSLEIESIADESLGDKRRVLIDELQGDEYRDVVHALADHRRALDSNADAIRAARQKALDLTERIEELGDVPARLATMPAAIPDDDTTRLTGASQQQQFNARERKALATAIQQHIDIDAQLTRFVDEQLQSLTAFRTIDGSENAQIFEETVVAIEENARNASKQLREVGAEINNTTARLRVLSSHLARLHEEQGQVFARLQAKNTEKSKHVQERMLAEQALATLADLEKAREGTRELVAKLMAERARLKGTYLLEREKISSARATIAASLEREAGRRVRVRVLKNADNLVYRQMLLDGLKGARVRNHDDIVSALLRIRPEELAELIDDNALGDFDAHTSLGEERSRKVLDAFRANMDPMAVEVVEVEDRIGIELNVGTDAEPNFKDASELSRGQKCTALLPLLLARRDTPLVIDQPEDNLDNHFIYETVVETIRRQRGRRQMLFVTHNANIPVLGEADLVVVMNSDGRRGFVHKCGSIDQCQDEIVDLLEGGREAFELRRRRYEHA